MQISDDDVVASANYFVYHGRENERIPMDVTHVKIHLFESCLYLSFRAMSMGWIIIILQLFVNTDLQAAYYGKNLRYAWNPE
jgi:hypothetical protein